MSAPFNTEWQSQCVDEMVAQIKLNKRLSEMSPAERTAYDVQQEIKKASRGDKHALNSLYCRKQNGFLSEEIYRAARAAYDAARV